MDLMRLWFLGVNHAFFFSLGKGKFIDLDFGGVVGSKIRTEILSYKSQRLKASKVLSTWNVLIVNKLFQISFQKIDKKGENQNYDAQTDDMVISYLLKYFKTVTTSKRNF